MAEGKKTAAGAAKSSGAAEKKTPGRKPKSSALAAAAQELIRMAEEGGVEQNYFFTTTFARYKTQLNLLDRLEKELDEETLMVEKEYVRNRPVMVANPAIQEYNKTSTSANQTVACLIKIINTFASGPVMRGKVQVEDEDKIDL